MVSFECPPPLTNDELEVAKKRLPDADYPSLECRQLMTIPWDKWVDMRDNGQIFIPDDGPWHITDHPNRQQTERPVTPIVTADNPMSAEQVAQFRLQGVRLFDTLWRPLHPRAEQLLTTPGVGMYTGPGKHYDYGPQLMGNLGVRRVRGTRRNPIVEYALVEVRRGRDVWGLPGGYAKPEESAESAAFREGLEEANLLAGLMGTIAIRQVAVIPKGFKADTLHAWGQEEFTFVYSRDNQGMDGIELRVNDMREKILRAAWVDVERIKADEKLLMLTHRNQILENEMHIVRQQGSL